MKDERFGRIVNFVKAIGKRLTYANVMATIAVFIALGGASYAAIKLPRNSVGAKQLKRNSVNGSKVAAGSIGFGDLSKGARPRTGPSGPAGTDGAAIVVRARSAGSVNTPSDGSPVDVPLSSANWTQGPSELDLGPYGGITVTAPGSGACGGSGFIDMNWTISVSGKNFSLGSRQVVPDGDTHSFRFDPTYLPEPGVSTANAATISVASLCDSGPVPVSVEITDVHFDVITAR